MEVQNDFATEQMQLTDSIKIKGIWQKLGFTVSQLNEAKTFVALFKTNNDSRLFLSNLQTLFGGKTPLFLKLLKFLYSDPKLKDRAEANIPKNLSQQLYSSPLSSSNESLAETDITSETLVVDPSPENRKRTLDDPAGSTKRLRSDASSDSVNQLYSKNLINSIIKSSEESKWDEVKSLASENDIDITDDDVKSLPYVVKFELFRLLHESTSQKSRLKSLKASQISEELKKSENILCQVMQSFFELDSQIKELEKKKNQRMKEAETIQTRWDNLKKDKDVLLQEIATHNKLMTRSFQSKAELEKKINEWNVKLAVPHGLENIPPDNMPEFLEVIGFGELQEALVNLTGMQLASLTDKNLEERGVQPFILRKKFLYTLARVKSNKSLFISKVGGPADWDVQHTCRWFQNLGFTHFSQLILDQQIPGNVLLCLNKFDVEMLGVQDVGEIENLLGEIETLRSDQASKEREHLLEKNLELQEKLVQLERESSLQKEKLDQIKKFKINQTPTGFVCCITGEIMSDPVIAADGFTYERSAIEQWLAQKTTSPMTNLPLSHFQLTPNRTLHSMILDFLEAAKS